jgi:hypothetical protein
MAAFRNSEAGYGDGEPNDTAGWHEIDISRLQPPDGTPIPFRLYGNRFKSSSPDSEAFLHDPVPALVNGIAEVDAGWQVTSFVVNHHRTLSKIHLYALAIVAPDEKTVAVTWYKQPPAD